MRIGKVAVTGNTSFEQANIRRSLAGLREGQSPDLDRVSSSLKLANENPAKKTTLQLASSETPGEVDATVNVTDQKAWRIGLTVDNTGTSDTGLIRVGLLYQHANVAGLDHLLTLLYTTSPDQPENVSIYGLGYHIPLYALGASVDLYAAHSNVDAGSVSTGAFDLQVSGVGSASGVRYNQNLGTHRGIESQAIFGLDYRSFENDVALGSVPLGNDVTVHPLSVAYAGRWSASFGQINAYLGGFANIPGGSNGSDADFESVRAGASANYTILRYAASYNRTLPRDWAMRLNVSGQYTQDALIPGEQFAVGGASSVRGFQQSVISNDVGYFYNAEIYTPDLCSGIKRVASQCRVLAFVDGARLSRNDPLPGEDTGGSIGSIGVGLRMSMDRYLTLRLDIAHVTDASGSAGQGEQLVQFGVGLYY